VAGLTAASALMGKGLTVVVLEKNICGGSSSGKSSGFLTPDSELELADLIRRFGKVGALDLWGAGQKGADIIAANVKKHGIECDFLTQDCLFLGNGESGWSDIRDEMEARKLVGFAQTLYDGQRVKSIIGSNSYSGAVRYPGTTCINSLRYCQGMKKGLLENGVHIYEASEVVSVADHRAETHLGSVTADQIIFCADKLDPSLTPFADRVYHAETFLSISEPLSEKKINEIFPAGRFQCWDSDLVYTYFRLTGDNRLLVGGGDMLSTYAKNNVNSARVIDSVHRRFKEKFPMLRDLEFIQYWPGRIDTTRDLLPTIVREEKTPWLHFVLGCVGLPWATFCGDFVARHSLASESWDDHHGGIFSARIMTVMGKNRCKYRIRYYDF
jgi:gamma-glutamylputrescine oxidase